jgi:catecholate siderophore receptor
MWVNHPSRLRPVAAAIFTTLQAAALQAHATEAASPQQLPKISVGADSEEDSYRTQSAASPKYTQPLRDTPQTITVIPQSLIKEQGASSLRDVLRNSPGITFQAGEGGGGLPGDQNFTMRGFSARNSLFIDGVRDTGAYTRDSFNLERVEVIKGPTGAVAGRSATSGAINQISKTPHTRDSQDYSLGYGSDDYKRLTADTNIAINDRLSLRLNAMYHDAEVSNRDVVENQRWGFAPSLALGLTDDTRLTLSYLYVEEDNVPDYGLPWLSVTQMTAANPAHNGTFLTGAYGNADQNIFYGLRDYDYEDTDTQIATAQLDHAFSDTLSLRNVTRYLNTDRDSAITAPRPPRRQLHRRTMGTENLTNLTDVTVRFATGGITHALVTGIELSREKTDNRNSSDNVTQPIYADFFQPDPNDRPIGALPANIGNPAQTEIDTVALYAFDTISFTDQWHFAAGARWDDADIEFASTTLATGATTRLEKSESEFTWHSAVVFKPVETASVYVSYGTGFDPTVDAGAVGPSLSDSGSSVSNINFDPEESSNLEVGTKWDVFDERLSLAAAIFRTEKKNVRTRSGTDNTETFVLSGEQQVDGVELSAAGSITPAWSVFGGIVYLDSEYESSRNPLEQGQELLVTPELSFSAWTTYALPIGLTLGAGVQYTDDVLGRRTADVQITTPDYWLVDAMAAYPLTDTVSLRLNATNLTDEDYVDRFGGGHYVPGAGRTMSLTANFNF